GIDALTVVFDLDHNHLARGKRAERQLALRRLSSGRTLGYGFKAVADGIANQVQDRVHHPLDQQLVDLRMLSADLQFHVLLIFTRQIANNESHALKDFADRHRSDSHHTLAQIAKLPLHSQIGVLERTPLGSRQVAIKPLEVLVQMRSADHHFANHPHQVVYASQIDAHETRWRGRSRGLNNLLRGPCLNLTGCGVRARVEWTKGDSVFAPCVENRFVGGASHQKLECDPAVFKNPRRGVYEFACIL